MDIFFLNNSNNHPIIKSVPRRSSPPCLVGRSVILGNFGFFLGLAFSWHGALCDSFCFEGSGSCLRGSLVLCLPTLGAGHSERQSRENGRRILPRNDVIHVVAGRRRCDAQEKARDQQSTTTGR